MDCRGDGRDGIVCHPLAAGYKADAALHSLYVQGYEPGVCVADLCIAVR